MATALILNSKPSFFIDPTLAVIILVKLLPAATLTVFNKSFVRF